MQVRCLPLRFEAPPLSTARKRRLRSVRVRAADEKEDATSSDASQKNDILERLAKAKAYKAQRNVEDDSVLPAGPSAFGDELERPEESERRLTTEDFQARFNRGSDVVDAPRFRDAGEVEGEVEQTFGFGGTSDRAASFLPSLQEDDVPKMNVDERPEDFTIAEEARVRSRGADVISVDKSYRPKVSTWGMYPRPANISEAYGGGRRIDPSQPLESEDMQKQRETEIAAALLDYKKKRGLYIEPEVEVIYTGLFDAGQRFLDAGRLALAAEKFEEASKVVDFKTKYGGEALLKRAICMDSMGKSKPAKAIYEQLTKHPQTDIRTQSKRMLFGFKAMDHLKVAKMKQTDLSTDYAEYFAKLPQNWNSAYASGEKEETEGFDDETLKLAVWMSGVMLVMPLLLILTLAFS